LGYIGIVQHKEHSPEVLSIPPGTPCIYMSLGFKRLNSWNMHKRFLLITNSTHFFNVFIYFTSLHVSSNPVLIIRRINCINTSSGMY